MTIPCHDGGRCDFCKYVRELTESSYAYLLGLYLGDGCIATHPRGVYKLRIFQDNKYTSLIRQCMVAIGDLLLLQALAVPLPSTRAWA